MKKTFALILCVLLATGFLFAQGAQEAPAAKPAATDFHIGVVTGTVSQSEDDLRGAERLISEYGSASSGGI
ncbi:MAG: DUF3798 domain-containing protein, partial [Sphaerochaeta sp.]|nr:DUF3798 domain-containing protein [Sphaerochaeta sp.]